jgi:hypothetical protein
MGTAYRIAAGASMSGFVRTRSLRLEAERLKSELRIAQDERERLAEALLHVAEELSFDDSKAAGTASRIAHKTLLRLGYLRRGER